MTVDTIMDRYGIGHVDLLKIDIEGGELDVFSHTQTWINSIDALAVELHDRIAMGCSRAFYLATEQYRHFVKNAEKVIAYRTEL